MTRTLKSLLENGKGNLKVVNQIFLDEILSITNVNNSIFIEVVFKKCTFDKLNLESTVFSQCKFHECTFLESNLNVTRTNESNFEKCDFIKSNFNESEINDTIFHLCQFEETSFAQAYLENCNFQNTKFTNIDNRGLCAILEDSKISMEDWSINFSGSFNFEKCLKFVNSI